MENRNGIQEISISMASQPIDEVKRKRAAWQREYRAKLRAQGLCLDCLKPNPTAKSRCFSCRVKRAAKIMSRRKAKEISAA